MDSNQASASAPAFSKTVRPSPVAFNFTTPISTMAASKTGRTTCTHTAEQECVRVNAGQADAASSPQSTHRLTSATTVPADLPGGACAICMDGSRIRTGLSCTSVSTACRMVLVVCRRPTQPVHAAHLSGYHHHFNIRQQNKTLGSREKQPSGEGAGGVRRRTGGEPSQLHRYDPLKVGAPLM